MGKIVFVYDDNDISIEGNTSIAFSENVAERFRAYGWHVIGLIDGMDPDRVAAAIEAGRAEKNRPSLIIGHTVIGYGSPKAGTAAVHGEPLGEDGVKQTRQTLGWPYPPFVIPPEALAHFRLAVARGEHGQQAWEKKLEEYRRNFPDEARRLARDLSGELPAGWDDGLDKLFAGQDEPIATREASGRVMNVIANRVHSFTGGSADLAPSTKTILKDHGHYGFEQYCGHNMHFGVREHAMGAIASGMSLHGGIIPYTGTFLIFYDYMRPPVRLAALMGIRVIYIFTHDSIGLGQDGPTHQPVEHLAGLRAIPGLVTLRPADATETAEAWKIAMARDHGPTALILTRQNLPVLDRSSLAAASGVRQGGYILWEAAASPDTILIATGSEVHIALDAARALQEKGVAARVVSLPSWELFDNQPVAYRDRVLLPGVTARISIEAASPLGWERYVGLKGKIIGLSRFGSSAPGEVLFARFGFTPEHIADEAEKLVRSRQ